jgi:hypothetical protein
LAATVKLTLPLPLPVAPELIVNQFALLVAAQVQPEPAVTLTVPVLALAAAFWLVALKLNVQPAD